MKQKPSGKEISLPQMALLALLLTVGFFSGCAHRIPPGGGPYDDTPPKLLRSTPEPLALHVEDKRVVLFFDEYVKVEEVQKKVIVSPPQLQQPKIMAVGKRVVVELEDDLIPNTTYTLDFTDAIVDNNESNPLENFSFAFSTGAEIDTMQISGMVLDARNLEPIQGVVVGIHPDSVGTTAFTDTTFLRMSRTSDRALFVMRNIKEGAYRVYALQENDGNYRHDMTTEGIAFLDSLIYTRSEPATRMDTTWVDSLTIDTVQLVHYTRFMPDTLVLRYFKPEQKQRHITKRERPSTMQLRLTFNQHPQQGQLYLQPVDSVRPALPDSVVGQHYVTDFREKGAVDIFFRDSLWGAYNRFAVGYMSVDSLQQPTLVRDTIQLRYTLPKEKDVEQKQKEEKEKEENEEGEQNEALPQSPFTVRVEHKGAGGVTDSIIFTTSLPINPSALQGIELYNANDSLLAPMQWQEVKLLPGRTTAGLLTAKLAYGSKYEIYFDSLTFTDIYGHHLNETVVDAFQVKKADEFSSLEIELQGITAYPYIVELLDKQDNPIRVGYAQAGKSIKFADLAPQKYAFRVIIDRNGNGKWDSGDYTTLTQPEEVYYSPKVIELMKNWEVKEHFNPLLTPLSQQKPKELIKNKPKEKKKRDLNKEREEELRRQREGGGNQGGFGGFGGGGLGGALGGMNF